MEQLFASIVLNASSVLSLPLNFAQIMVREAHKRDTLERRKLLLNTLMSFFYRRHQAGLQHGWRGSYENECEKQVRRLKSSLYCWYPREVSLCCFFVLDLEVSKGIGVLRNGNDSQEFLQVLLLEVLLGQVLKVSLGEGDLGLNNEVVLVGGDGNCGSEVSGFVVNLNFLGHE